MTDVTRQTTYRAVAPLEEAGLVRERNERYTLTCSGARLLQAYSDIDAKVTIESLARLARSSYQQWLLRALSEESIRKSNLVKCARDERAIARTTVHRIITCLQKDGYVELRADVYELSETGELLYQVFGQLQTIVAGAIEYKKFIRWLPAELDSFPLEALEDSTLIHNTPDQPHNVLNAFVSGAKADLEGLQGMSAIWSPTLDQAYRPVIEYSPSVTVIFTDQVLFQFHSDHRFVDYAAQDDYSVYLEEGSIRPSARLLFVPGPIPLHLAIYDDSRVIMAPAPSTGVTEAESTALESSDSCVIEWVQGLFNEYLEGARPPIRVFQEHVASALRDEQSRERSVQSSLPQTKVT
jgi:predicted transcriptional regulator